MDTDVLRKVLDQHLQDKTVIDTIVKRVEQSYGIKQDIRRLNKLIDEEHTKYKQKIAEYKRQISDIQKLCTHDDKTFFSDPSGGSDSFHKCNICEAHIF